MSFLLAADVAFVRDVALGVALGTLIAGVATWAWRRLLHVLSG